MFRWAVGPSPETSIENVAPSTRFPRAVAPGVDAEAALQVRVIARIVTVEPRVSVQITGCFISHPPFGEYSTPLAG
jgi:hypothetical protein